MLVLPSKTFANTATSSARFIDDEVIVKLKPSAPSSDINPLAQAISGEVSRELLLKDRFLLKVPKGTVEKAIKTLSEMPQVAEVSPNYVAQKQEVTNDSAVQKEWGLFQIQAASLASKSAWNKTAGKPEIKVAVLDTGIEKAHPDLEGKVITEKNFTTSIDAGDRDGHGTHVAGIIAAAGDNVIGIAGVSYKASLLNGKVLNDEGNGSYANVADGIIWAADNDAKVINLSLGGTVDATLLEDAINYAYNKGAVIVAAAGNLGMNTTMYPAHYENVLSVAATDETDSRISVSNFGQSVKIAAPGDKIYSTYKNNSYSYASGTSMASAFAAGVAALVWSTESCSTNVCVINRLETTSDKVTETGTSWKFGRINALKAVLDNANESTPSGNILLPSPTLVPTIAPDLPPPPSLSIPTDTPTPTIQQNIISVSKIEMWTTRRYALRDLFIRVTVVKQSDKSPVQNAEATIDLTAPDGTIYTGTSVTDNIGQVTFALQPVVGIGEYKAQLTDLSMKSYIYKPTKIKSQLTVN